MSIQSDSNAKSLFDATITLAAIPAYLYFCTYLYEYGFCLEFNVPTGLISINIDTILYFSTKILASLTIFSVPLGLAISTKKYISRPENAHLRIILGINSFLFIGFAFTLQVVNPSWKLLWYLVLVIIINFFYWMLPLIIKFKQPGTVKEKLSSIVVVKDDMNLIPQLIDRLPHVDKGIVSILALFMLSCLFLGIGEAVRKVEYNVVNETSDAILIRKYNEILIIGYIDLNTKKLKDSIKVIKIGDSDAIKLTSKHKLGPLNFN